MKPLPLLVLVCLLGAAVSTFGAPGEISENAYHNKYVGLRFPVPVGWYLATDAEVMQGITEGAQIMELNSSQAKDVMKQMPGKVLLWVSEQAPNSKVSGFNRNMSVAAINIRGHRDEIGTGADYLRLTVKGLKKAVPEAVVSEITTQRLGGEEFHKLDARLPLQNITTYQSQLARIANDYLIIIHMTAENSDGLAKLSQLANSLSFFPVPHELDSSAEGQSFRRQASFQMSGSSGNPLKTISILLMVAGGIWLVVNLVRRKTESTDRVIAGEVKSQAATKKCPKCAEEIKLEAVVCRYCGHQFETAEVAEHITGQEAKREEIHDQFSDRTNMKKCPKCAEEIKLEALVCRYCGYQFDVEEVETAVTARARTIAKQEEKRKIQASVGKMRRATYIKVSQRGLGVALISTAIFLTFSILAATFGSYRPERRHSLATTISVLLVAMAPASLGLWIYRVGFRNSPSTADIIWKRFLRVVGPILVILGFLFSWEFTRQLIWKDETPFMRKIFGLLALSLAPFISGLFISWNGFRKQNVREETFEGDENVSETLTIQQPLLEEDFNLSLGPTVQDKIHGLFGAVSSSNPAIPETALGEKKEATAVQPSQKHATELQSEKLSLPFQFFGLGTTLIFWQMIAPTKNLLTFAGSALFGLGVGQLLRPFIQTLLREVGANLDSVSGKIRFVIISLLAAEAVSVSILALVYLLNAGLLTSHGFEDLMVLIHIPIAFWLVYLLNRVGW